MKYIVGVDTGGTFTDVTVMTPSGELFMDKAPTTPHDFSKGIMDALGEVSASMNMSMTELLKDTLMLKHGSTVSTNALITREGARVGLITTKGFEDTTLIMRAIGRVAGLDEEGIKHQATARKPEPIVPKELIRGVTERIDFRGNVVIPINVKEVEEALRYLVEEQHVEAIAINLLFGFVNPVHEKKVKEYAEKFCGDDVFLSVSHEVMPVIREYARSNTVIINAFLGKTVRSYVRSLSRKLKNEGYRHPLLIMQSNGGIVHEHEMTPIGNLNSGPCGGVIATKYVADILGHSNVISTDMGGTSFDVGLIVDGYWRYSREPIVERFHITWPMIDVESIGAGGGTIATVDPTTNRLLVGPKSAGADPGPICYDLGGKKVTVTDADLVLGYLNPDFFLGGRVKLKREKAEQAIEEKIARPLGLSVPEAAAGIYDIINSHMSDLIRKQVVRTGHIPEEFSIYSFGGAGPVHAAAYAADLGIEKVYIFPSSSVFSAFGITVADIVHTSATSYRYRMPVEPKVLNVRLEEVENRLLKVMKREGFRREDVEFRRIFFLRYRRQLNELAIPVPVKVYDQNDILEIMGIFDQKYDEVYGEGSAYREAGVELISMTVDAIGRTAKPTLQVYETGGESPRDALRGSRQVFFSKPALRHFKANIYDYDRLKPGNVVEGPSVIETRITTIVIPPEKLAKVDPYMNVEISI
ncbi:MAG: hydantoinase/oxoprolinase family protein [Proteobacteria bacterium]|nr:hydantoinase/oxoprolinase family protein [Pseudomonadota bacterium]